MIWEIEKLTNDCHDRLMIFYHGHMTYDVDKILLFLYYVKWNSCSWNLFKLLIHGFFQPSISSSCQPRN